MSAARVVCPTLHVEQLHDERAWTTLRRSLEFLAKHGGRATTLVSTLGAQQEGYDLGKRLRWIADQGHEIAMHTHFRAPSQPKHVLTDEDIRASLDADYEYLVGRGHQPRGFCAGGWKIYAATNEWLSTHGFQYDCSFRSFELTYDNPLALAGNNHQSVSVVNRILEIPTTATLKAMLLSPTIRRCPSLPYEGGAYTLFYLHDWDLLPRRKETLFRLLAHRLRHSSVVPVQEIVRTIGTVGE